ncbi:MAG: single-stranded-DNA-specific exonuclease RecJ [Candidatus Contendobacter odensis]|uniref:Single-stranded-DNA-specific exonuclease RecJ n=1 Tax=Candidatus Contendibacter odensensis TaxID=1400860 RepID=A0A2G6PFS3_9GAMM|nr:MAG: single-stranded-DNA-specific exonuclease RecJ [Candidatus Contendobacter odensis]
MSRFIIRRDTHTATDLPASPLLQRIYAARQIRSAKELDKTLASLTPPGTLKNIEQATDLLYTALRERWRITIIADFDADGATSCALAVRVLRAFGVEQISYRVPNRFEHNYGLTAELVTLAAADHPDLLITVDNGISSHEGVQAAQLRGMKVLITDHHLPGQTIPPADVIINPNQPGDTFPGKCLAGVGVIFYVLLALRARLRDSGWFTAQGITEPNLAQFLDLVALGTVADVVPLDHTNRILVEQGLRRIRENCCIAGITALCHIAKRPQNRLTAADIGFYLAPRLNAAGRLEDMQQGIECLLSDDPDTALAIAQKLDAINRQRHSITTQMQSEALERLDKIAPAEAQLPFGLCLFDPQWHQGVVGIIAGRLREQTHRPTIVFAPDGDHQIKGSGRSVNGLHLRDTLAAVATAQPGLIRHFGGHAMAVGLSLDKACFERFSQAFDTEVRRWLTADDLHGQLLSDGELTADDFSLDTAKALREGGPWGQGFPEPLFDGVFEVQSHKIMKENHLKLWLQLPGTQHVLEAVAFRQAADFTPGAQRLRIAYRLDINDWRNQQRLQLMIEYLEPVQHG